jgi:hypothetical protein
MVFDVRARAAAAAGLLFWMLASCGDEELDAARTRPPVGSVDAATDGGITEGDAAPPSKWRDRCAPLRATYAAPPIPGAPLRTLYVDAANGNDANTGLSPALAWKTLSKANGSVTAGDLVLLTGAFTNEQISPKASGTADKRIIYRSAPGQTATLTINDGTVVTAIQFSNKSFIVIDGFKVQQLGTGDGLYMIGSNSNWLRNVEINGGTSRIFDSADNRIEDSSITTTSDPMFYIRGGISRTVFARNALTASGGGISFGMGDVKAAESVDNVFFENDFANRKGGLITISGVMERTQFLCNTLHEAGIDNSPGSQGPTQPESGGGPALLLQSSNNVFRYNVFYGNKWEIVRLQAYGNCTDQSAVINVNGNVFQHNVFYGNGGPNVRIMNSGPGPSGCGGATPKWGDTSKNVFENNIYWNNATFCDFHFCQFSTNTIYAVVFGFYHTEKDTWPNGASGLNGNVFRNNFVGRDTERIGKTWMFWEAYTSGGAKSYTYAAAETAFPVEITKNSEADPMLRDPANKIFEPVDTSPVVDFGAKIEGLPFEGAAPDPGRFEYTP